MIADINRLLIEFIVDYGIFLLDDAGNVASWNRGAAHMTGYSAEIVGQAFSVLYPPAAAAAGDPLRDLQAARATGRFEAESKRLRKDGSEIWCLVTISVVSGDEPGFAVVLRDVTERRAAREALRRSELRFRSLATALAEVVWTATSDGAETKGRTQWRQFTGLLPQDGRDPCWLEAVHEDERSSVAASWASAVKSGQPYRTEFRARRADGAWRNLDVRGVPVMDGEEVTEWVGVCLDVTEHRQAMAALQQSEERLRLALRGARLGTWNWDVLTGEVRWSDICQELFGLPPATITSYSRFLEAVHPDDRALVEAHMVESFAKPDDLEFDYRTLWPDGSVHWIASRGSSYFNEAGVPILMKGVVFDITPRKRAEEALAESERRLRAILESEPECVKLLDEEGRLIEMNPAGLAMIEADSAGQVIGERICRLVAPEHVEAFEALRDKVFAGESGRLEFKIVGLKGTQRWVDTQATPLRGPDGRIVALLGVTRDMTLAKVAEERYQLLAHRLQTVREEESGRLARRVHDELGQLLIGLRFELASLARRAAAAGAPERDFAQARSLTEEIIQTTRQIAVELRPAILDQLGLGPALEWLGQEFTKRHGLPVYVSGGDSVLSIPAEKQLAIFRVAQEALTNIARHANATRVGMDIAQTETAFTLVIRDNGQGFEPDKLKPLRSVGMFSMQERSRLADGICEIDSRPEGGTTIRVVIRRVPERDW